MSTEEIATYDPALDPAAVQFAITHPRSSRWPAVRAEHLRHNPECVACGARTALEAHHIEPYHVNPGRELDPTNLVTLCTCPSHNCHLIWGHLLDWRLSNPTVIRDAHRYRVAMIDARGPRSGVVIDIESEITQDWLDAFDGCKANGDDLAASVFWRIALEQLPIGVNPDDPRVVAALDEIRAAVAARGSP